MTSRKIVIATWIPCTVVSRSWLMSLIITFMFEPAKLQMNCASAKGISTLRSAEGDADVVVSATAVRAPGYREPSGAIEFAVEGERGADQREMGEGLGKVPDLLSGGVDLFRIESHMVRVCEHLREGEPGVGEPSRTSERVDVEERAEGEGPLGARQAVGRGLGVVAIHETVLDQGLV